MSGFERKSQQRGFSLLEVLIAVVIFAIGLLAIASLQGDLMRGGNVAKSRTVASSLAEQQLEELKSFLEGDDYGEISPGTETIEESGVTFERETEIQDYHYTGPGSVLEAGADEEGNVDVKLATISVSWCGADSGPECDPSNPDGTDAHSVMVQDFIGRSASAVGSARVLSDMLAGAPPRVPYDPGEAPTTIRIDLEDGSEKESPQPTLETTRGGSTDSESEKVNTVTRLESITFNTLDTEDVSIQRQEFLAANCTCQTGPDPNLSDEENIGHTPVFWEGDDWIGRIKVEDKPVGHFPNDSNLGNQLNVLCSTCCRDHHDGGSTTTFDHDNNDETPEVPVAKYNPFRDAGRDGDHDHFDGTLTDPVDSGSYLEACRFARVDGRMQLTTDFRLESLQVLPGTTDALDPDSSEQPFNDWIADYQSYVKDFLEIYATEVAEGSVDYPAQTPEQGEALPTGDEEKYGTRTSPGGEDDLGLPSFDDVPGSNETRQMVGRAIYLDYLHPILQDRIKCRLGLSPDQPANCDEERDASGEPVLPILPFSEVNVALQANWAVIVDDLVTVTDEPVSSSADSIHSRGAVTIDDSDAADSDVVASIEQGNAGLTDTHHITPFDPDLGCMDTSGLFIDRLTYEGSGDAADRLVVSGCLEIDPSLIEGDIVAPSDIEITDAFGKDCGTALGDNFFACAIQELTPSDTNKITVTGYSTNQDDNKVCLGPDSNGEFMGGTVTDDGKNSDTTEFDGEGGSTGDFVEENDGGMDLFVVPQDGGNVNCTPNIES